MRVVRFYVVRFIVLVFIKIRSFQFLEHQDAFVARCPVRFFRKFSTPLIFNISSGDFLPTKKQADDIDYWLLASGHRRT